MTAFRSLREPQQHNYPPHVVVEEECYFPALRRQCDKIVNGYQPVNLWIFPPFEMAPERSGDASSQAHVSASPRKRSRAGAAETPATLSPIRLCVRGDSWPGSVRLGFYLIGDLRPARPSVLGLHFRPRSSTHASIPVVAA